jgi:hypothetical protein
MMQFLFGPKPRERSFLARFREWTARMDGRGANGRYLVSPREYRTLLSELDDLHCLHIPAGNGLWLDGFTIEPDHTLNDGVFDYHHQ